MTSMTLRAALGALLIAAGVAAGFAEVADAKAKKKKTATKLYYRVNVQFTGTEIGPNGSTKLNARTQWYLRGDDPVLVTRTRKGDASFPSVDMTGYVTRYRGTDNRPAYDFPRGSCGETRMERFLTRKELLFGSLAVVSSRRDGLILDGRPTTLGGFTPVTTVFEPPRCVADDGSVTQGPRGVSFGTCCAPFVTGGRVMGLVGALVMRASGASVPLYEVLRFTLPKKDFGRSFGFQRRHDITNILGATASFNYTVRFTYCPDSDC
jgi:hypothetical protein